MRIGSALGLMAAIVITSACAHPATEVPAAMSWAFNHTHAEGLKLVYGQPRSDNVLVMLSCQPDSGQVEIAVATADGMPGAVALVSRRVRLDLTGASAPTPVQGVGMVIETTRADTPALDGFARTGDLLVRTSGRRIPASARGEDQALVSGFFGQCGRPA
ncbi:MAG: hypothetical protein MH112_12375 [Phenylobacterium sp.]|uniref:hypothetical protein n=1 Tax=Phenylobacterium sp. TaxID=1871053 RepID=UPI0025DE2C88|nr:hypothetical protein [Phenylobacterium sp.]MCG9917138.1 hypothetical protein [Phenylobacterium sp.]